MIASSIDVLGAGGPAGSATAAADTGRVGQRLRRFAGDRWALAAVAVLVLLLLGSLLAPWLLPHGPAEQSSDLLSGPGGHHLLGTDEFGRDLGTRLLVGAKVTLEIAFGSAAVGALVGVPLGLVAGYLGRVWDVVPMRVLDVVLALPDIVVALVVVAALGNSSLNLVMAIGIAGIPVFARLTRASVLTIRDRDFVVASRSMGASTPDTMLRTVLPNVLGPVIVQFVITAAIAVVVSAGLGFLGLGPPPPAPSWGGMLQTAKSYLYQNPWYGIFPGLALVVTVGCLDRIGAGLQRAFGTSDGPAWKRTS